MPLQFTAHAQHNAEVLVLLYWLNFQVVDCLMIADLFYTINWSSVMTVKWHWMTRASSVERRSTSAQNANIWRVFWDQRWGSLFICQTLSYTGFYKAFKYPVGWSVCWLVCLFIGWTCLVFLRHIFSIYL